MSYEPGLWSAALRQAQKRKATARPRKALVLAGLVESRGQHKKYQNVGSGDRDSVGFLQQRPSQGWGPAGETVEQDADQFLDRAIALNAKGFRGSAGQLAQAVQRSAFPDRYDKMSDEAERILRGALGSTSAPSSSRDASHASSLGQIAGTSSASSQAPSLYDVIRRYDIATDTDLTDEERSMQQSLLDAAVRSKPVEAPKDDMRPRIQSLGSLEAPKSKGKFKITGPNPGRLKPHLVDFAEQVAEVYGKPIQGSDGTGHSYYTVNGNVSQHSTGDATDIPARGQELILMGQAALIAAGMPESQARKQKGGLYNVGGHQIIFNTHEGGDHTDHLHISARGKRTNK